MKIFAPMALTSVMLISACSGFPQQGEVDVQTRGTASTTSASHNYRCESGETVVATYASTDSATVRYKGSTYNMQIAVSGSGSRYVGGELEWWTKGSGPGSEGTLFRHMADGTTGDSIEQCAQV